MSSTPPIPESVVEYGGYFGIAFAGSFLRASKWRDEITGKIIWFRVLTEIPTAIAVGCVAAGIGAYRHLDPVIVGGISGTLGLLGPAFFTAAGDTILGIIKARFGG